MHYLIPWLFVMTGKEEVEVWAVRGQRKEGIHKNPPAALEECRKRKDKDSSHFPLRRAALLFLLV
jgi:hypothetical protein